ncbi:hypothetical protein [Streptomyces sp. URMC 129]|uniref:hypothetical protein n=1 Tax=Streptomyces sp. URMC 129 TaxID=3423407 RepID=UPI003F1C53AF
MTRVPLRGVPGAMADRLARARLAAAVERAPGRSSGTGPFTPASPASPASTASVRARDGRLAPRHVADPVGQPVLLPRDA